MVGRRKLLVIPSLSLCLTHALSHSISVIRFHSLALAASSLLTLTLSLSLSQRRRRPWWPRRRAAGRSWTAPSSSRGTRGARARRATHTLTLTLSPSRPLTLSHSHIPTLSHSHNLTLSHARSSSRGTRGARARCARVYSSALRVQGSLNPRPSTRNPIPATHNPKL